MYSLFKTWPPVLMIFLTAALSGGLAPRAKAADSCYTPDGNAITLKENENCPEAQRRVKKALVAGKYKGSELDYNQDMAAKAAKRTHEDAQKQQKQKSASQKAEAAAGEQKNMAMLTGAGALAAGYKMMTAKMGQSKTCTNPNTRAPCAVFTKEHIFWAAATASLVGATGILYTQSKKNKGKASEWRGGLGSTLPEIPGPEGEKDPPIPPPGSPPGFDPSGLEGLLPPPTSPTPTPNGPPAPHLPDDLRKFLTDNKIKWDPKKQKLTLPDGYSVSAEEAQKTLAKLTPAQQAKLNKALGPALNKKLKAGGGLIKANAGGPTGKTAEAGKKSGGGFKGYGGGGSAARSLAGLNSRGGKSSLQAGNTLKPHGQNPYSGMAVQKGNSLLGVKNANIFQMVHDRYQTKRKSQGFIEHKLN